MAVAQEQNRRDDLAHSGIVFFWVILLPQGRASALCFEALRLPLQSSLFVSDSARFHSCELPAYSQDCVFHYIRPI
ncbi:hypothetical protein N7486_004305 [Penicillium sp. IBT 16267x]|nr:hypothetical protein N7486_004305 [Penicillium sp. IBT 16267x]